MVQLAEKWIPLYITDVWRLISLSLSFFLSFSSTWRDSRRCQKKSPKASGRERKKEREKEREWEREWGLVFAAQGARNDPLMIAFGGRDNQRMHCITLYYNLKMGSCR
jgi:hypothetical protein